MVGKAEIVEENRRYFDKISPVYSRRRREKFGKDYANRIISQYEKILSSKFPKPDVLLDMGCGVGKILLNLKLGGAASEVYGIDISRGMLKECMANSRTLKIAAHLIEGNVESLPFLDHTFDMVIGHAFLHHIPGVGKIFSEVYRVLKPGGMCVFTEPSKSGSRITLTIQRIVWLFPWLMVNALRKPGHINIELHTFAPSELENLALDSGFKEVFTAGYAGFVSRMFYWVIDPIAQRIPLSALLGMFDCVIRLLDLLDETVCKRYIPKDWFDEVALVARKETG